MGPQFKHSLGHRQEIQCILRCHVLMNVEANVFCYKNTYGGEGHHRCISSFDINGVHPSAGGNVALRPIIGTLVQ
ncbi:hypothetical protein F5Y05DRAFT_386106 [Hypoxylon sp. FL0543]|nr:hypothetical protein F5Y05DRAFT_386106 [Hypoxylon sp. FL0543]